MGGGKKRTGPFVLVSFLSRGTLSSKSWRRLALFSGVTKLTEPISNLAPGNECTARGCPRHAAQRGKHADVLTSGSFPREAFAGTAWLAGGGCGGGLRGGGGAMAAQQAMSPLGHVRNASRMTAPSPSILPSPSFLRMCLLRKPSQHNLLSMCPGSNRT